MTTNQIWQVTRCDNDKLLGTFESVWDARALAARLDRRGIATNVTRSTLGG